MPEGRPVIRIAAALILDPDGRLLLVRKAGTIAYMQAGGKIEQGEQPLAALRRELEEEIGLKLGPDDPPYLGSYLAPAANEAGSSVLAELFHVRTRHCPVVSAEIEDAIWIDPAGAKALRLAPLTRVHVLPLAARLSGS